MQQALFATHQHTGHIAKRNREFVFPTTYLAKFCIARQNAEQTTKCNREFVLQTTYLAIASPDKMLSELRSITGPLITGQDISHVSSMLVK